MFKRNWSIWLFLAVVLSFIIGHQVSQSFVRDARISIEDYRQPEMVLQLEDQQASAFVWTDTITLAEDENFYHAYASNGTAYYVTAVNQLREQFAYTYRLYHVGTEASLILELPDAKPYRLRIEGADAAGIILSKEYSDNKTSLISYNQVTKQQTLLAEWRGGPEQAKIDYFDSTISLIVDQTWRVMGLTGVDRPIDYPFPSGAVVGAIGASAGDVMFYYEVEDLRYVCLYNYRQKKSQTFLVNNRVDRIYRQAYWAITQAGTGLQLYTWPDLAIRQLVVEGSFDGLQPLNHELVEIAWWGQNRHYVFDTQALKIRFNQVVTETPERNQELFHYFSPALHRINLIRFEK